MKRIASLSILPALTHLAATFPQESAFRDPLIKELIRGATLEICPVVPASFCSYAFAGQTKCIEKPGFPDQTTSASRPCPSCIDRLSAFPTESTSERNRDTSTITAKPK